MDNPLQDIDKTFERNLPAHQNLNDYLFKEVIPQIRHLSEDLREEKFYVLEGGKPWLEITDNPNAQEAVLHFFNTNGEYLKSVDGNVSRGRWRLLDQTNKMIIEQGGGGKGDPNKNELYELAFLNPQFFILKKHSGKTKTPKFLFLGYEGTVRGLKWLDCVELLYNEYRNEWSSFNTIVVVAVVIIVLLFFLSYF
ncbi:MAG: hypothetical protein AAFZ15_26400 [Bacteroidota bacterium]